MAEVPREDGSPSQGIGTPDSSGPEFVAPGFPPPVFPSADLPAPGLPGADAPSPAPYPPDTPSYDVPAPVQAPPAEFPSPVYQPSPGYPPQQPVYQPSVWPAYQPPPGPAGHYPGLPPAGGAKPSRPGLVWVLAGAVVVLVALVVWLVAKPQPSPQPGPGTSPGSSGTTAQSPGGPTPGPAPSGPFPPFTDGVPDIISQPAWSSALGLGFPTGFMLDDTISARRGDIVIVSGEVSNDYTYARNYIYKAVDLDSLKVLWTISYNTEKLGERVEVYADEGGLVFVRSSDDSGTLDVVDTLTGQAFATATLDEYENVVAVESGLVITDNYRFLCARALADPGSCQWQLPSVDLFIAPGHNPYVFNGGQWVNTGKGVVELATGQPVSFGADVAEGYDADPMVYYTGDSADRIFRVDCVYTGGGNATCHYQPWDTTQNKALAPAVTADFVIAPPGQDSFAAVKKVSEGSVQVSSYSWGSSELGWQADHDCDGGYCFIDYMSASLVGDIYAFSMDVTDSFFVDARTGQAVVPGGPGASSRFSYIFTGQRVIYLAASRAVTAYDATADGFPQLWSLSSTDYMPWFFGLSHHIFAVSDLTNQLWVLQP